MKKFSIWFRSFLKYGLLPFSLVSIFVVSVVVKLSTTKKQSFYNFEAYIDPQNHKCFEEKYRYNVFQSVNEFAALLQNSKSIGGITSDFQVVSLIKKGLIKPINFSKIYGKEFPANSSLSTQEAFLKKIWRPQVWELFASFDKYLEGKKYWQYVVPYYLQDRVIAYNVDKLSREHIKISQQEQEEGIDFKGDFSIKNILQTLMRRNYKKIGWINSLADNLLLGALHKHSKSKAKNQEFNLSNLEITQENFEDYIDGFSQLVEEASGAPLKEISKNVLISDGLEMVTRLIDPNGDLDVALMYNGDALDAYYYEDNFPFLANRDPKYYPIKFVRPFENLKMVDVLVVSSSLNSQESDQLLETFATCVYKGINLKEPEIKKFANDLKESENFEEDSEVFSSPKTLPWLRNFDYINYTPTHRNYFNFIQNNYFGKGEDIDVVAKDIYKAAQNRDPKYKFFTLRPIDSKLSAAIESAYFLKTHS